MSNYKRIITLFEFSEVFLTSCYILSNACQLGSFPVPAFVNPSDEPPATTTKITRILSMYRKSFSIRRSSHEVAAERSMSLDEQRVESASLPKVVLYHHRRLGKLGAQYHNTVIAAH
jgi:hypothetical protein